jgi:asparagine synthase (glutamine-hydrolysing)
VSVQFGRWNIDGAPVDQDYLAKAGEMLTPYGPDGGSAHIKDNVGILYRAFHTTKESRKETQPFVTPSGAVLCWDGRLDNREELVRELRETVTACSTDLAIVAAAYEVAGTKCFAHLIGDWALSVWDPRSRSLILAKDPIGTRHLYYSSDEKQIIWSTILDPLVLLAGKGFTLEEEYIAGCLSFFPATHLTPYVGIHSVPPSSSVLIRAGKHTVSRYWDFDPGKRICYNKVGEYEEHFRTVFVESVRRRLRSDSPILGELSGGIDSSSIVCVADTIIASGVAETPRLDTISYYDDSEPNWNERPYFTKVEEKRGRTGCHIDTRSREFFKFEYEIDCFAATPALGARSGEVAKQFEACVASRGNRVVLSGIGGDEVTGGVPTPTLELTDLLAKARFKMLAHQLKVWALNKRKPWSHLLYETARGFFPPVLAGVSKYRKPAPWLNANFIKRNRAALHGYESRLKLFGPRPSFQDNLSTLDMLRRQLECSALVSNPTYEWRYPYLDRNLLEFLYAVPREQLVRPGQRRSLMRRALLEIIPDELLNRKRKAYLARAPMKAISTKLVSLVQGGQQMVSTSLEIIEGEGLRTALQKIHQGREVSLVPLIRTLSLEFWLRGLRGQGVLPTCESEDRQNSRNLHALKIPTDHPKNEEFSQLAARVNAQKGRR